MYIPLKSLSFISSDQNFNYSIHTVLNLNLLDLITSNNISCRICHVYSAVLNALLLFLGVVNSAR